MKKSFLFNISKKDGLPGGPNEEFSFSSGFGSEERIEKPIKPFAGIIGDAVNNIGAYGGIDTRHLDLEGSFLQGLTEHHNKPEFDFKLNYKGGNDKFNFNLGPTLRYAHGKPTFGIQGGLRYNFESGGPKMNLGGLFGRKKKSSEYKPGAWADSDNSEVTVFQEDEEQFDIPLSKSPEPEFATQDMSEEELQAALIKSEQEEFEKKYKAAYDQYKPQTVSYKGIDRPKAEFVLAETYEANPELFQDAGYTANKLESGNYELFQNKDISDMIYRKGFKPGVFENTYGMGSGEDIEKKFAPVYADAERIHAKRNAEKIEAMMKETVDDDTEVPRFMSQDEASYYSAGKGFMTTMKDKGKPQKPKYKNVDEVIDVLVSQGEGTKEGLSKRYKDYANGLLNERDFDQNLKNQARDLYKINYEKRRQEKENAVMNFDKNAIASVDAPIYTPVKNAFGDIEYKDQSAYTRNTNAIADYDNFIEEEKRGSAEKVTRNAIYALANNEKLSAQEKQALMADPEKLSNLISSYAEYESAPMGDYVSPTDANAAYYGGGRLKGDFYIDKETGGGFFTEGRQNRRIDGGVDMLDKQWIKGVVGLTAAPMAYEALGTAMNANLGSLFGVSTPGLTAGNIYSGIGAYNAITKNAPGAYEAIENMMDEGINKGNMWDLSKNVLEGGSKLIGGAKALKEAGLISKAPSIASSAIYKTGKDLYGQGKYGSQILSEQATNADMDLDLHKGLIGSLGMYMPKKQYGGTSYAELTDDEIQQYRDGGYVVEEIGADPPEYPPYYNERLSKRKNLRNLKYQYKKGELVPNPEWQNFLTKKVGSDLLDRWENNQTTDIENDEVHMALQERKKIPMYLDQEYPEYAKYEYNSLKNQFKKLGQGGNIIAELTDDEIKKYREGGWIVEEI